MRIAPLVGETVGRVSDSLQRLRRAGLAQAGLGGWVAVEEPRSRAIPCSKASTP
ncbi:hypothetical protein [Methylorubrum thiocyanatum]|uniref:hypothetical protein n=1 Tax=Methylorubrum thiocyanatum TaxID=47958 RepID=UPI0035C7FB6D